MITIKGIRDKRPKTPEAAEAFMDAYRKAGSLRELSRQTGTPATTIREWYKHCEKILAAPKTGRFLIWDVECSTSRYEEEFYDLKNFSNYRNHKNITRDWVLLGASWMFLEDDKPEVVSVTQQAVFDDYGVVCKMHEVLCSADVLIGHNSDAFDLKKFNTRAIKYGLPPIPPKQTIDTLKLARKYFKFTSNSLAYVANFLEVGMKNETPDWEKIIAGDADELRYMRRYNKQDVLVTKNVYLKLRAWDTKGSVNKNVYSPAKHNQCKVCLSDNLVDHSDYAYTKTGKYALYRCGDCGGITQSVHNLTKVGAK
jgi:hypothetical protein